LASGGRLVIVPPAIAQSPAAFSTLVREQQVTILNQTPSALRQFIEQEQTTGNRGLEQLRLIVCGGEAFPPELAPAVADWPVWNFYGPTEATVWASSAPIQAEEAAQGHISIGHPLPNTQLYVLDEHLQPTPPGVLGELYIGGDGLAYGYHGRPELTAERFIPNPFVTDDEGRTTKDENSFLRRSSFVLRLYKTGDLARYLPDGNIEFLGRADHQVKVRGYRIELGEIEAALAQHSSLRSSVVVARASEAGENRLVAYVVSEAASPPTLSELRTFLKARLPDYMLPSSFIFLDALPLTPNGKIDRRALSRERVERSKGEGPAPLTTNAYRAPRTATEVTLAQICSDLLGITQMGIDDNFFELGGHSLLATRIVVRIREAFQVELSLRTLFEHPTLADLAEQIDQRRSALLTPPDSERLAALLAQVQSLSDQEVNALLKEG
jgi:acyl-coenzyme A synthetase/AMP-(fatty) acid ligase/acyl carrier protein